MAIFRSTGKPIVRPLAWNFLSMNRLRTRSTAHRSALIGTKVCPPHLERGNLVHANASGSSPASSASATQGASDESAGPTTASLVDPNDRHAGEAVVEALASARTKGR